MSDGPSLTNKRMEELLGDRLKAYESLNLFEKYAMFMGKAQLLEFGLKGLLERKYGVTRESTERWTLGRTKCELESRELRADFVALLDSLVDYRNDMAHEFLVNNAITGNLGFSSRKQEGDLYHAVHLVEQIIILFDWFESRDSWS